jgi:DNA phosphorothioation-dependent restriction protein DptG
MTSLTRIFSSKAQTRVLQYLLDHRGRLYNQAGLSRLLNMSPSTIARILTPLIEEEIINFEQLSGQMKIIALNEDSEKTTALIDFYDRIKNL